MLPQGISRSQSHILSSGVPLEMPGCSALEPVKHRHQPVNREPRELALPHPRKVRRRTTGHFMRRADADVLAVEHAGDFGGETDLQLLDLGIWRWRCRGTHFHSRLAVFILLGSMERQTLSKYPSVTF
jgi:hypothetical protein